MIATNFLCSIKNTIISRTLFMWKLSWCRSVVGRITFRAECKPLIRDVTQGQVGGGGDELRPSRCLSNTSVWGFVLGTYFGLFAVVLMRITLLELWWILVDPSTTTVGRIIQERFLDLMCIKNRAGLMSSALIYKPNNMIIYYSLLKKKTKN